MNGYYRSISDLEFSCEEYALDGLGRKDDRHPTMLFNFALTSRGLWSMRATSRRPDGAERVLEDTRCDGKHRYFHFFLPERADVVNVAMKSVQVEGPEKYNGTMCYLLSMLIPAGKTLPAHLEDGAKLVIGEETAAANPDVRLVIPHRGSQIVCRLDPHHGWLASQNFMGDDQRWATTVTRFSRDSTRWFPTEGVQEEKTDKGVVRRGFRVVSYKINQGIPSGRFRFGKLQDGTIIQDRIRLTSSVQGGMAARRRFRQEFAEPPPPSSPTDAPIVAPRAPEPESWPIWIGGLSGCLLLAAFLLKWHNISS